MLPLRLHLENFGSFREPADVDLHDVDHFALVGPTGAGKSTVIDAICFALYGTVPRWGNEKSIAMALAPSATAGKVALVFESGGRRYGVVRALTRSARGVVNTKEARLDELDPGVDAGAGIEELLEAVVRPLAQGDGVTVEVQRLTGLEYRFFTQCVILPQGRFAEFLHATPSKRQDLLVQLLDAEVYEEIRSRAKREEDDARRTVQMASQQLAGLSDADPTAEDAAKAELTQMRGLVAATGDAITALREHDRLVAERDQELRTAQQALSTLAALAMPNQAASLAGQLRSVEEEANALAAEAEERDDARTKADEELAGLGDKGDLQLGLKNHREHQEVSAELQAAQAQQTSAISDAEEAQRIAETARGTFESAQQQLDDSRTSHVAADLAEHLALGEPCPVCRQTVDLIPVRDAPLDVETAKRRLRKATAELDQARARQEQASVRRGRVEQECATLSARLSRLTEALAGSPGAAELQERLEAVEAAQRRAQRARNDAARARTAANEAATQVTAIQGRVEKAWRELDAARDTVVVFGAPAVERTDLQKAWSALLSWRDDEAGQHRGRIDDLDANLAQARELRDGERSRLRDLLEEHGVQATEPLEAETVSQAVATASARAEARLDRIRENQRRATELAGTVRDGEDRARVAHELVLFLQANNFEKWLCSEALSMLVTVASGTLRELSGGQFELLLSERSEIEVVDYAEAGLRRNVRTLSGGETFQASLALALALSDQVTGLAATRGRSLDSIFLDEGFGTLDPATLDTVATTLERLVAAGDRMVGVVTHVPALAERVPVRFEISRDRSGSHVEKKA